MVSPSPRSSPPPFTIPAIIVTLLIGISSGHAAQTANPGANPAVQLPSVTVTAQKEKANPIFGGNPLFDHTFADLAGGPLIEAIFWRHRYLTNHPQEDAVILKNVRARRLVSATTLYSRGGKIYASSNALGESVAVPGLVPADLHRADGLAQAAKFINDLRQTILNSPPPPGFVDLGFMLIRAEESGGYLAFRPATTTPEGLMALDAEKMVPGVDFTQVATRQSNSLRNAEASLSNFAQEEAANQRQKTAGAARQSQFQDFTRPSAELVSQAFAGLHDPAHAGLVPVALGETTFRGARVPCVVFDWDGVQYTYQPDRGTTARPLPKNPFTGLPYLCIQNGALMESVYFRATYSKEYPDRKAVVVPGDPAFAAFETDQNLGLFFPRFGYFSLAKNLVGLTDDQGALAEIRQRIVAREAQPGAGVDAIAEQMPGDDGDMQMRRAFLALQAAGVPCQLDETGPPSLNFIWEGATYAYRADQQIHAPDSVASSAPSASLAGPNIKLPTIEIANLPEPTVPDLEPEIPDLGKMQTANPNLSVAPEKAPPPTAKDKIVMMPPVVVAAARISKTPWRYVSLPGFEVLTRASDGDVKWDLNGIKHSLWIQNAIIPKEWLPELPVPCTVIIDNTDLSAIRTDQPHSQSIKFSAPSDPLAWGDLSGQVHSAVEPISTDGDTFAVNSNVFGVNTSGVTYDSINLDRLLRSTPPLPGWVISGLLGRDGLFRGGFLILAQRGGGGGGSDRNDLDSSIPDSESDYQSHPVPLSEASGPGTLWVSSAETQQLLQQLKRDKATPIPLLPLAEFFAETPPPAKDRALWESEAGLFLRWGLMGPGHEDPAMSQAFLALVSEARQEPVTEKLFTDCFGFGYGVMEDKLEAFLKTALASPTRVRGLKMPRSFSVPKLRVATADETGRMLGDWIRMQGETLRLRRSPSAPGFFDAAGEMLWRAYRDDNSLPDQSPPPEALSADQVRDPNLLAVYGLYERDAGRDAMAGEFLEAAVKANVVRPRAYQVLAELRLAAANAKPLGANGRISVQQAAAVLEPLQAALRFPASLELYDLMVDTWGRCDAKADSVSIKTLVTGAALFPRSTSLTFKAALLCARNGYRAQADELVRQGLVFAIDAGDQTRFQRLRSILEGSPVAGPK
jgi:hypothetical protein